MSKRYQPSSVKSVTFSTILMPGSTKRNEEIIAVGKPPNGKKSRGKQKEKIINPSFIDASNNCVDEFWENILHDMAYNKCPSLFSIRDNKLIYRSRNKIESITLTELTNPDDLADQVIKFLKTYGRIKSQMDLDIEEQQMRDILAKQESKVVNPLANESSRNFHVHSYATTVVNRYGLNENQWNQLVSKINMTYFVGLIDKSDFIFDQGQLIHVNGIIWNNSTNQFDIDPSRFHSHSKSQPHLKPLSFHVKEENNRGFNFDRNWQNISEVLTDYANKQNSNEFSSTNEFNSTNKFNSTNELSPVLIKII